MNEESARDLVRTLVGDEAYDGLARFHDLVVTENDKQNLVARSTVPTLWSRHILDSVQLIRWSGHDEGEWIDIGTGGGFPGLAVALATKRSVTLVEPRRLRADFLVEAARQLGLSNVIVEPRRIEAVERHGSIISARAVAPIEKLLQAAGHCATPTTRWLFPRGRLIPGEIDSLRRRNKGMVFHVEQSLSDPSSSIVIVTTRGRAS